MKTRRGGAEAAVGEELPPRSTWEKVGTLATVVGVLVLCGVVVVVLRRMQPAVRDREGNRVLEVLGRVPVSPKQQVSLVRVGSRVICVGISPDRLSCLSEITDANEVARLLPGSEFGSALAEEEGELLDSEEARPTSIEPSEIDQQTAPFRDELSRLRGMVSHWRFSAQRRRTSGEGRL